MKKTLLIAALASVTILSGCGSTDVVHEPIFEIDLQIEPVLSEDEINRLTHHAFFNFDSDFVSTDVFTIMASHGKFIASHPNMKVLVEGHADDTGDEPYNKDLGLKRAKKLSNILVLNGVNESQIIIRTYSTDKPLSKISDKLNRRATIIY
jgi:peptidoglycan-associated lipoprotein